MSLRARLTTRPAALLAAGGVLVLAVGGFAVAAIPSADGTLTGCYSSGSRGTGALRIIDPAKTSCASGETAISWNQAGQPGLPGPSGPSGPPGPTANIDPVLTRLSAAESSIASQASGLASAQAAIASLRAQVKAITPSTLTADLATSYPLRGGGVTGVNLQPGASIILETNDVFNDHKSTPIGTADANGDFSTSVTFACHTFTLYRFTSVAANGDPIATPNVATCDLPS